MFRIVVKSILADVWINSNILLRMKVIMLQLSVPHDQQPFDKVFKVTLELTKAANNVTTKYVNFMIRRFEII